MRTMLLILALVAIGCESEGYVDGGGGAAATCYTTSPSKKCESCGGGGGFTCTSCTGITVCNVCQDVSGDGCWKGGVLVKCSWGCPSGAYLNGEKMK